MARSSPLQTNFSAGELSPDLGMRQDTGQYQNGAKSLRNRRCMIGGGTKRRPGSGRLDELLQSGRAESFTVNESTKYVLVFSDGRMDAFAQNIVTKVLTAAGSVTGAPWTGNIWREMDYESAANTAFLTHQNMAPQKLLRTGASTWTRADFAFYANPSANNRIEQPFFRVADITITLTPAPGSTQTLGLMTVLASAATFTAGHVGSYLRIQRRQLLVTVFTDSTHVTANAIEAMWPTIRYQVDGSGAFSVGEIVQGKTSGKKGIVAAIPDATHLDIVMTDTLNSFDGTEDIVGPHAKCTITLAGVQINNAAVADWDESIFSAQWGYPACVALHRNRILFGGHRLVGNGLIGSRSGNLFSFDLGDESDGDGIFETIGDAGASTIVQLHSAEQLLVLTDHGPYYVPEGQTNPFRPVSIAFFPFGSPWPITTTAKAKGFDDGVLFCSGSLIIKAKPTGNQNKLWSADDDVSVLANHLLDDPTRLAVTSNFDGRAERYATLINTDGTLAVLQLVESQKIRNLTPWDTDGQYQSVAALSGDVYITTQRVINGLTRYFLEHFDQALTLDCAKTYADLPALDAGVPADFGSTTVHVTIGSGETARHLGTWPLQLTSPPPGPYTAGLFYDTQIETLPPVLQDQEGSAAGDLMRICEALVTVKGSQRFTLNGYTITAYQVTDDIGLPPPVRNGPIKFEPLGWLREPTLIINQPDPLPLEILAIKSTVAF